MYHLNYASNHHLIPFYSSICSKNTKGIQISHKYINVHINLKKGSVIGIAPQKEGSSVAVIKDFS